MLIGVIDYGVGNLFSLEAMLKRSGRNVVVSDDVTVLSDATHLVLPGVGQFATGMNNLCSKGLDTFLQTTYQTGTTKVLGICLGMQLMFDLGLEGKETKGLGFVRGKIIPLERRAECRVPHIGWDEVLEDNSRPIEMFKNEHLTSHWH